MSKIIRKIWSSNAGLGQFKGFRSYNYTGVDVGGRNGKQGATSLEKRAQEMQGGEETGRRRRQRNLGPQRNLIGDGMS